MFRHSQNLVATWRRRFDRMHELAALVMFVPVVSFYIFVMTGHNAQYPVVLRVYGAGADYLTI